MNITMNIDCSPEEARRLMGLPDMAPIHEMYMDRFKQALAEGLTPEMTEQMVRHWAPMGDMGLNVWKQMVENMTGGAKV